MKVALIFKGGAKNASAHRPIKNSWQTSASFSSASKFAALCSMASASNRGLNQTQAPASKKKSSSTAPSPRRKRSSAESGSGRSIRSPKLGSYSLKARPENLNPAEHGTVEIREIYEPADYGEGFVKALSH